MQLHSRPPVQSYRPVMVSDDVPVYQILKGKFFAPDENGFDRLYPEGSVIAFLDEPNMEMKPLNEMAWKETRKYLDKLDVLGMKKAEKDGVAFVSERKSFEAAYAPPTRAGKGVVMLNQEREVPIMQGKKSGGAIQDIKPEAEVAPIQIAGSLTK